MWLATQLGFFSIVQKPSGQFHVRTRCKKDLENLLALTGLTTRMHHSKDGDYAWRFVVEHEDVSAIMVSLATTIDYPNFKSRIHELPDQKDKLLAYSRLWMQMLSYQSSEENK